MRGTDEMQETLFTMVKLEDFVPTDHPLRPTRELVNQVSREHFSVDGTLIQAWASHKSFVSRTWQ